MSATFSALSDPTRRLIVDRLMRGPATVNEIAGPFAMSQQAVSKHLAYLEKARLISKVRDGRQHVCRIEATAIREVADWADGYRQLWEERYERLDGLLEEMKAEAERPSRGAKGKRGRSTHQRRRS